MPILAVIACLLPSSATAYEFSVAPSSIPGVVLTAAGSAESANSAAALPADPAIRSLTEPLLPYAVEVNNASARTIVYYVVRFERLEVSGKRVASVARVDGRLAGAALKPGAAELVFPVPGMREAVSPGQTATGPSPGLRANHTTVLQSFGAARDVTATLDCVIFDDWTLAGPDKSGTLELLNGIAGATRDFLESLRELSGSPVKEIRASINETMSFRPSAPEGGLRRTESGGEAESRAAIASAMSASIRRVMAGFLSMALDGGKDAFIAAIDRQLDSPNVALVRRVQ